MIEYYDEIIKKSSVVDEASMREMLDMEVETISFFQKIIKDLDENEYFNVLDQSIYAGFAINNVRVKWKKQK